MTSKAIVFLGALWFAGIACLPVWADDAESVEPHPRPETPNHAWPSGDLPQQVQTQNDLARVRLGYFGRILVDAYLASPDYQQNPDPEILDLIRGVQAGIALHGIDTQDEPPGDFGMKWDQIVALVGRVSEKPNLSPWAHYGLAYMHMIIGPFDRHQHHGGLAQALLDRERYPDLHPYVRTLVATANPENTPRGNEAERQAIRDRRFDALVELMSTPFEHPAERRIVLDMIWNQYVEDMPKEEQEALLLFAEIAPDVDPWILASLHGYHFMRRHRNSGLTNDDYRVRRQTAREAFMQAVELAPEHPEPYTELIRLATWGIRGPGETPRGWFELAQQAQFDWYPAYTNMLEALRPRYGGSYPEMLAFGRAALATGRFETRVPHIYLLAVRRVIQDSGDDHGLLWRDPQVWRDAETYFAGVEANHTDPVFLKNTRDLRMVLAYRAQRFDDAFRMMEALGGGRAKAWHWAGVHFPFWAHNEIRVRQGELGPVLAEAQKLREADRFEEAIRVLNAAKGVLPHEDRDAQFLRAVRDAYRASPDNPRPQPIDLLGPDASSFVYAFAYDKAGWDRDEEKHTWTAVSNFTVKSDRSRYLHTGRIFGPYVRVTGAVEVPDFEGDGLPNASVFLQLFRQNGRRKAHTVHFVRDPDKPENSFVEIAYLYHWHRRRFPVDVPEAFAFRVDMQRGRIRVWIDDREVADAQNVSGILSWSGPYATGIGFRAHEKGQTVRFSKWSVEPISRD
ncbi:MAG: hypothetical protein AAF797_04180 [Planctomycetota bacterium]